MTRRQILLSFVPPLCFGAGFTIAKPAVSHFPPLFMMFLVYGAIAILLALTVRQPLKTPLRHIILISAFAVTIQGAFLFWALRSLPATTANLLLQIQVPMAVLLGWLVGGERLDARKIAGTLISLLGVGMVIGLPPEPPPIVPTIFVIACAFFWALGQVFAQKYGKDAGIGLLKLNAFGSVPQLLIASFIIESGQLESVMTATPLEWGMLAFVGLVGFYLAYVVWFTLLKQCRMDEIAPFILLMPVVGFLTAYFILGEPITLDQVAGGLVILLGLAIVAALVGPRKRAEAETISA